MSSDEDFLGHSDPTIMSFVYTLIMSNNITEVLELGTQIGFSAIVMGDALVKASKRMDRQTSLDTVEASKRLSDKAREYIQGSILTEMIHVYDGASTDQRTYSSLRKAYDLIYVDSSHSYDGTREEIRIYWPYLKPSGIMIFHDSGEIASEFDPTKKGGVRRALMEWVSHQPSDLTYSFLDPPIWANPCGMFLAVKLKIAQTTNETCHGLTLCFG